MDSLQVCITPEILFSSLETTHPFDTSVEVKLVGFMVDGVGFIGIETVFSLVVRLQKFFDSPLILVSTSMPTFGQLKLLSKAIWFPGLHTRHSPELKHFKPFGTFIALYISGFGSMVASASGYDVGRGQFPISPPFPDSPPTPSKRKSSSLRLIG